MIISNCFCQMLYIYLIALLIVKLYQDIADIDYSFPADHPANYTTDHPFYLVEDQHLMVLRILRIHCLVLVSRALA